MTDSWEYKLVLWTYSQDDRIIDRLPKGTPIKRGKFSKSEFRISESGKEPEIRLAHSTYDKDDSATKITIDDLLTEFGAQGWELVSENVLDTTIMDEQHGWRQVGTPVQIRWILKRRPGP